MSSGTGSPSSSYNSTGSLSGLGLGAHRNKHYGANGGVGQTKEKRRRPAAKREDDDDDDEDEDEDDGLNGILPTSEVYVDPLSLFLSSPSSESRSLPFPSSSFKRPHDVDTLSFISVVAKRREEIRRQRIESEQRRRDELRDGYRKLKEVLPASNQKSSKVSLLDRGMLF